MSGLRRTHAGARMPTLLYAGVLLSAAREAWWLLVVIAVAVGQGDLAPLGGIRLGGMPFTATHPVTFLVMGLSMALTWAFWTGRSWARHGAVALWLAPLVYAIPLAPDAVSRMTVTLSTIGLSGILAWYLFRTHAVRAYFAQGRAGDHTDDAQ